MFGVSVLDEGNIPSRLYDSRVIKGSENLRLATAFFTVSKLGKDSSDFVAEFEKMFCKTQELLT